VKKIFESFKESFINEGYTHKYTLSEPFTDSEWKKLTTAAKSIIKQAEKDGISIKGGEGKGKPEITNVDIWLNGDDSKGESHETFMVEKDGELIHACKTNQKPYDAVVVSILAAIKKIRPDKVELKSDGGNEVLNNPIYECDYQELEHIEENYKTMEANLRSVLVPLYLDDEDLIIDFKKRNIKFKLRNEIQDEDRLLSNINHELWLLNYIINTKKSTREGDYYLWFY
jgi:hypothetical protein